MQKQWQQIRTMFITMSIGAAFGFGTFWLMKPALQAIPRLSKAATLAEIAVVIFAAFALILLHELGHLTGGLLVGFEFSFVTTGPLRIYKQDDRIHISWNKSFELWGGIAACYPKDFQNLRQRMFVMVAGGPVASLLIGAILWFSAPLAAASWLPIIKVLGATSLALGIVNVIPMRNGRFQSDGGKLLTILQGGPACDRMIAITTLAVQIMDGIRPRDLQPALIAMLQPVKDLTAETFGAAFLVSQYHFDKGDYTATAEILDHMLANVSAFAHFQRPFIYLEAAFWEARMRNNPVKAREYQELGKQVPPGLIKERTFLFTEAVILQAEGRLAEAAAIARRAIFLPATFGAVVETELLQQISSAALS